MPIEDEHFPIEVQQALSIHTFLPDVWDGSSGSYMGKNWAALTELLDSHNIEDRRTVIFFLKFIDNFRQDAVNEKIRKERKEHEAKIKAPVGNYPKSKV